MDVDLCERIFRGRNGFLSHGWRADRRHRAAAIHVLVDGATVDGDFRELGHRASTGAVVIARGISVFAQASPTAENAATASPSVVGQIGSSHLFYGCLIVFVADFARIDGDIGIPAHMAVLAAAKHRAVDARACGGILLADGHFGMVGVAEEELGVIENARRERLRHVGCCRTTAAAVDVARGNAIVHAIDSANLSTIDIHCGLAGVGKKSLHLRLVGRCPLLAVAGWREVARTAGVVALAHRGQVAAAIHVAHHIATLDGDVGAAIHLARREAGDFRRIGVALNILARIRGVFGIVVQGNLVGILALAAAIDGVANQSFGEGDVGRVQHMAVFGAAIYRASNAPHSAILPTRWKETVDMVFIPNIVLRRCSSIFIINHNRGVFGVGAESHIVAVAHKAPAAAIHVAIVFTGLLEEVITRFSWRGNILMCRATFVIVDGVPCCIPRPQIVLAGDADAPSGDVHMRVAAEAIEILVLVRPAQGEGGGLVFVFGDVREVGSCAVEAIVDEAHRSQLAAAKHVLLHPAAADVDVGLLAHHASESHGRVAEGHPFNCGLYIRNGGMVVASIAAAIHAAPNGAAAYVDVGVVEHQAELAAAKHVALDDGRAADVDIGELHLPQDGPFLVDGGAIELGQTAHRAAEHVAAVAASFFEVGVAAMQLRLIVVADGAARDVDGDVAVGFGFRIGLEIAINGVEHAREADAYRGQTSAAINGAEHGAAADVERDVAAHRACGDGLAREATTTAKHVAVEVGIAPCADEGSVVSIFQIIDVHRNVAEHMAVLAAAEDGAEEEGRAANVDFGFAHVGPSVEQGARVALAAAEEVAGDGVRRNRVQGARHAKGAARHGDGGPAAHVGHLVAAIDGGENVTACDFHRGVAIHLTCRAPPYVRSDGIVARAAAEHVAEKRVAVRAGFLISIFINKGVERKARCPITPVVALMETCDIVSSEGAVLDFSYHRIPLVFSIRFVPVVGAVLFVIARTNLSVTDFHLGVA